MTILSAVVITFIVLLAILFVVAIFRSASGRGVSMWDEDEVTTTTTTYHDEPSYNIVGFLERKFDNNQPYVIDPVDGDKVWINTNDDMYEDGAGKIWKLR